jgi:uncharacterized tellurite resistance protein B-like protein
VQDFAQRSAEPNDKIRKAAGREPNSPKYLSYPREPRHHDTNSGLDFDYANWLAEVRTIEEANQRRHDAYCAAIKSWYAQHNWKMDWEPLPFPKPPLRQNASSQEVTIQEVAKPQIQKPVTYKITTPIERFREWLDDILERNQTVAGGHWLLVGPMNHIFASDAITIGLCRQIADIFESRGYCVEPDARFGSGTYERDQTLALFTPLNGNAIKPSTAYLGAANLLRLCILITTADGKIDLVELETFHSAVTNQVVLSQTDQKRLIVLEQLLAQELCSASKVVARITKSISADQRLVVGKLLVDIAAANNFISNDERRALERIFTAFEIPDDTLYGLIRQACP